MNLLYILGSFILLMMLLERLFPRQDLPVSPRFYAKIVFIIGIQVSAVYLGGIVWSTWMGGAHFMTLTSLVPSDLAYLIVFVVYTFIYYWWHRLKHTGFFWRAGHQLHHSPGRIEAVVGTYQHPLEIYINVFVNSGIYYGLFNLKPVEAACFGLFIGMVDIFQHTNIKTPRFIGYFVMRPEMHIVHHNRGQHCYNFGFWPWWDMLFGTYRNPSHAKNEFGFKPERERRFFDMLILLKNVNGPAKQTRLQEKPLTQ
ncbi:MAG: sterol desaturase family protein [Pseudomonadota bacterium]